MIPENVLYYLAAAVIVIVVALVVASRRRTKRGAEAGKETAYARALGCLIEGRRDDAIAHLKDAVRLDPDNVRAYIKLGDLLREKGDVVRALQVHRELTVRHLLNRDIERDLYHSLARDYLAAGRLSEAQAAAEKILGIDKRDEQAMRILLEVYESRKEWDKSYEIQEELLRLRKGDGAAFLAQYKSHIGADYMARGDLARSKKYFESALHMDRDCLPALFYLGELYYREGDLRKAIESWSTLAERHPQWAFIVYGRLEKALYESGTFGEVEKVYERVLRARPNDIPTLLALAEINHKRGVFDEAMRLVKETLEIEPDCRRARQLLVRLHLERGDTKAALDDVMSFLEASRPGESGFTCSACGHKSREVLFRCPSCRNWNTFLV